MRNPPPTRQFLAPLNMPQYPIMGKQFQAPSDPHELHQPFKKPRVSQTESSSMMPSRRNDPVVYKTRLCHYFTGSKGSCPYGERCVFAHGNGDRVSGETPHCRIFWKEGKCRYGDKCRYLHTMRQDSVISISTTNGAQGSHISGSSQFGHYRSLGMGNLDTRGVTGAAGRRLSTTCIASGGYAHRHAAPRKLCGHTTVKSGTVQTKQYSKTYIQQMQDKDCNSILNELEKMSGIYADWIEDIPSVHNRVEC